MESMITTAIAKVAWKATDHDEAAGAPAPLVFFKLASHTSSSSCSWLGFRNACLPFPL
jgi:hypothetical protein